MALHSGIISKCFALFFLFLIVTAVDKPKKKTAKEGKQVSSAYVYKKLRQLERSHDVLSNVVDSVLVKVEQLSLQMDTVLDGQKGFSADPACPDTPGFYVSSDGKSCYGPQPSSVMVNWTTALSICKSFHPKAHLVSLETQKEHDFVAQRWRNERGVASFSRYWTSGTMLDDLTWQWTNSKKAIKYPNWIPTTTHSDLRFRCLAVLSSEGFKWGDSACWAPQQVLCEIDL